MRLLALLAALGIACSTASARAETVTETELTPMDAVGYKNGRKLQIEVVEIGWALVEINTAKAFLAMQAAAAADGIDLWIRSGFRSWEEQEWFYQAWKEGWGNKAARPGHSNHQSGRALDLDIDFPGSHDWLKKHARRFGFKATVRGEPWHWEYTKKIKKKKAKKRAKKSR